MKKQNITLSGCLLILNVTILIITIIYVKLNWSQVPEEVISHFNVSGQADSMGGKGNIIFMLIMELLMSVVLFIISYLPFDIMSFPMSQRSPEIVRAVKRKTKNFINLLGITLTITFTYIIFHMIVGNSLGFLFLPLSLGWTILFTGYYLFHFYVKGLY